MARFVYPLNPALAPLVEVASPETIGGVPVALAGRWAVPTIHPAAVLRGGAERHRRYDQLVEDLSVAANLLAP